MAYTKTNWVDRVVQKPLTYTLQNNADGTTTLIPAEGTIVTSGTPLTGAYLNNLEKQYEEALAYFNATPVWQTLALQPGIQTYSSGTEPVFTKKGTQVNIQGAIKNITATGVVIGILPSGYRPSIAVSFALPTSGKNFARWTIGGDGKITLENVSQATSPTATDWFPVSMSFVAMQ